MIPQHRPLPALALPAGVFLAALLLQWPLVSNPGYYSHDELQWAAAALDGTRVAWRDLSVFQYRPLTFNLWMALSRALFETPMLFHAVLVGWGSLNAALLCAIGRGFGMRPWPAVLGALAFVLTPYAAYTHGWVGCIGDLAWLSCALLLAALVQRIDGPWKAALPAAALTAIALLAKEAAFAIPPLLAMAWLFDGRKRKWLAALLASGTIAALYLALRADVLLHAPREGAQYALGIAHVPARWMEYQLFPPIVPLLETFTTTRRLLPAAIAGALWLGLLAALWRASPRSAALFLLGGLAALLPVLPLAASWNHYAYGFAAVSSMAVAAAWPTASRAGRIAIALFAALTLLHGASVMARMQRVGRIQSVFSPALAEAVRRDGDVALRLAPGAKAWVFTRLTHDIPRYRGVEIGERVRIVGEGEPAGYLVQPDGRLQPLR